MLFYAFLFFVATLLYYIGSKGFSKQKIPACVILTFCGGILALVGGLRDLSVGTDIAVYGEFYFRRAQNATSLLSFLSNCNGEYGYHGLMWICSRMSDKINFMLFVLEFIKALILIVFCLHFRRKCNSVILFFAYLVFFYITGFNTMRQSLAVAIVMLSAIPFFEKKYLSWGIATLCAVMFHSSAIVVFLLIPFFFVSEKKYSVWFNIIPMMLLVFFHNELVSFLADGDSMYASKATMYIEREGAVTSKTNIMIAGVLLLSAYVYKFKNCQSLGFANYGLLMILLCYNLLFLFASPIYEIAFRLSWYQLPFIFILYLTATKDGAKEKKLEWLLCLMLLVHFVVNALHGYSGGVPYTSHILGI